MRRVLASVLLVLLSAGLVACGSDLDEALDLSTSTTDGSTSMTEDEPATSTTEGDEDTTSTTRGEPSDEPATSSSEVVERYCLLIEEYADALADPSELTLNELNELAEEMLELSSELGPGLTLQDAERLQECTEGLLDAFGGPGGLPVPPGAGQPGGFGSGEDLEA